MEREIERQGKGEESVRRRQQFNKKEIHVADENQILYRGIFVVVLN